MLTVKISGQCGERGSVDGTLYAGDKVFSSGSDGYYASDKITTDAGVRYQVGITITRIGSKPAGAGKPTRK